MQELFSKIWKKVKNKENEVEILHKDDSILLSFDVMNNYDEWKPLLKETFEKQHEYQQYQIQFRRIYMFTVCYYLGCFGF